MWEILEDANDAEFKKNQIKGFNEQTGTESNLNPFAKELNEDGTFKNQFDDSMNTGPGMVNILKKDSLADGPSNRVDFWADSSDCNRGSFHNMSKAQVPPMTKLQALETEPSRDIANLPPVRAPGKQFLAKMKSDSSMSSLKKGKTMKVS